MRKAIQVKVTLWIEGEDEPAHDFAKSTTQAVREMLSVGRWRHPGLKVTIKRIEEDSDEDEEEEDSSPPAAPAKATGRGKDAAEPPVQPQAQPDTGESTSKGEKTQAEDPAPTRT